MTAETQTVPHFTADDLAQEIRRVDGTHDLGAGALADALMPFLAAPAPAGELREVGQAILDRWDSPLWKDQEPTAVVMNRLRAALAAPGSEPSR